MVKVAGIQFSTRGDTGSNLEKALELATLAAEKGAGLVAFPELCTTKWFPGRTKQASFDLAETIPGPSVDRMARFAADHGLVVVFPIFEKAGKGKFYNSAAVIDADGRLLGVYRKIHIPNVMGWHEKFYFLPGDLGFPVFETRVGRLGVQISWDVYFPEGSRILALKGAELVVVPTSNAYHNHERWERMMAGNALANGIYFLRVNRVGREEKQSFYGKTFCMNPDGDLIQKAAGLRDSVHISVVDFDEVLRTREEWAFFRDRREDQYGAINDRLQGADSLGLPSGLYSGRMMDG